MRRPKDMKVPPMWSAEHGIYIVKDLDSFPDDVFLPVPGFPELEVNKLGQVFCNHRKKFLNQHSLDDYMLVSARDHTQSNKYRSARVHRIVAAAFYPNPENKPQVNHKNGIRNCNHASNLEWATSQENVQHAFETGLISSGLSAHNAVFDAEQVRELRLLAGTMTLRALSRKFGMSYGAVRTAVLGITYADVDPGYVPSPDLIERCRMAALAEALRGENAPSAIFTNEQIKEIRSKAGLFTYEELGRQFGTTGSVIRKIINGFTYPDPDWNPPTDLEDRIRKLSRASVIKLSDDQIREIRKSKGIIGYGTLAKRYGVGKTTIKNVMLRKYYQDVPD